MTPEERGVIDAAKEWARTFVEPDHRHYQEAGLALIDSIRALVEAERDDEETQ